MKKNAFQKSIGKKDAKKEATPPLLVECGGLRAASRNARFLLRKIFAMIFEEDLKNASTPGGVRRIEIADARTAALHETPGARICEEVD